MKNVMICSVLALSLWLFSAVEAEAQLSSAFFAVRPEQMRYLRYDRIVNEFDSAVVSITVGEFKVSSETNTLLLPLFVVPTDSVVNGIGSVVRDNSIAARMRTEPFAIPTSTFNVTFFRELLGTNNLCALPGNSGSTGIDKHWTLGSNKVAERTEFIIEMVRQSDGAVICTVDSVGVLPNPTTSIIQRYGTFPDHMNHSRTLSGVSYSDSAYFRIVPARDTLTPFGFRASQMSMYVNLSAIREYSDSALTKLNSVDSDSLQHLYYLDLKQYYDSTIAATGSLPYRAPNVLPVGYESQFLNSYYVNATPWKTDTILWKNNPGAYSKIGFTPGRDSSIRLADLKDALCTVEMWTVNSGSSNKIDLIIKTRFYFTNSKVVLFDMMGRTVAQSQIPFIYTKNNKIQVDVDQELASGSYVVVLFSSDNQLLSWTKIVYEK